jgi:hypothetical protein
MSSMWIAFSLADDEGQWKPGFALEVQNLILAGITDAGIQFDVLHMDGEKERMILGGTPWGNLSMGKLGEHIMQVRITPGYPAVDPISKDEFRARVGTGAILNELGHFQKIDA